MDLAKSLDFFNPHDVKERIFILGCGATGSVLSELLIRAGLKNITIYDDDIVVPYNVGNQMFRGIDIGRPKVEAMADMLMDINPEIELGKELIIHNKRYVNQKLHGYVFLCVDNIDTRREICVAQKGNRLIKAMFDFRMGLTDGQIYAADWQDIDMIENLIASMDFTHEEALAESKFSACNVELSVAPTIRSVVAFGVTNFMEFAKNNKLKKMILCDSFAHAVQAFA